MSDISSLADMHVSFDIVLKLISFANNLKLNSQSGLSQLNIYYLHHTVS